jgi:ribosomal protein S18 acetylase RimI-like enzyme
MIELIPPFRLAEAKDAPALAELVNFAGEGLPLYLWDRLKQPGQTAWDVGLERARREKSGFSYRNAVVAEIDGKCAACLIGYPQPEHPEPIDYAAMPPIFVPLQELENLAANSWYVNVLAAYPDFRGQGLGTKLLAIADELADATGKSGLSLIMSDANEGARRLYERRGYREAGARPMVKEDWENQGRNWILLTKPL